MSDENTEVVEESQQQEDEAQVEAKPDPQLQPPVNTEIPQRPENVPEKFWDAEKGELRKDELLKSNAHLEKFVGGKKEELKDELLKEIESEAEAEKPESYDLPALPEGITEEMVLENPLTEWWRQHCYDNAYNQDMFEDGVNQYIQLQQGQQPDLTAEVEALGENAKARIDNVNTWASTYFSPDQFETIQMTLGQTAEGIEILERVMSMRNENISSNQTEPINKLSIDDVRQMMKDPRYFDPKERDESYVRRVDDAFARLYR